MEDETLLAGLTTAQRQAVLHVDGPLLVLAGAGSGKTRVITHRAVRLAKTAARPDGILAITFTNKAAGEMRERIAAWDVGGEIGVCTFHALCARLLREHASLVGLEANFTIFDEGDRRALLRRAIADCDLHTENWTPQAMEARISEAKNRMQMPEAFLRQAADFEQKTVARVYAAYQALLLRQNACDFDDLLLHVASLLDQNETLRETLSRRFRYLLIDEYQDTNHAQYVIAARLASLHRNICATGDPDQAIYAWRGADIGNILDFERDYPDARVVRLEQNFRSTGAILSAASALIACNSRRKEKSLWTQGERGEAVRVWTCEDEQVEAERIAEDIRRHLESGGRGGDVAVFYRVNALTRTLEEALRTAGIAYQIVRGVEFYERKEVKDVLAYARAIVNPADELSLVRAAGVPPRGIGARSIDRLRRHAHQSGQTLDAAMAEACQGRRAGGRPILAGRTAQSLAPFVGLMEDLRRMPTTPVAALLDAVLKRSGLEEMLADGDPSEHDELANVGEVVTAARQYDEGHPAGTMAEWLQQISLATDLEAMEWTGGPVTMMTLHMAKGLEFPVVYVVGVEDGLLPHRRAQASGEADLEEERRLCFVGMTRAKRRLTLTRALYRMTRGVRLRTLASPFLRELPDEEIEHQSFMNERHRSTAHLGRYNREDPPADWAGYRPGQNVRHPELGEGQIDSIEPQGRSTIVRIRFAEHGVKSFALEQVTLYTSDE